MAVLEVDDLVAGYGGDPVLRGVSLYADKGEIVTVIGPNGAGKSTLLKAVTGLVRPSAGTVRVQGTDVTGLPPERLVHEGVAYVPQVQNVFPSLTIRENLEITFPSGERADRVRDAVERVLTMFPNLRTHLRSRARVLSGGERQMLAIARSVMLQPFLVILDEPSAALAPSTARDIFQHIRDINAAGATVLLVEQNARRALAISHRGYILDSGRNALTGTGAELLGDPDVAKLYLGSAR